MTVLVRKSIDLSQYHAPDRVTQVLIEKLEHVPKIEFPKNLSEISTYIPILRPLISLANRTYFASLKISTIFKILNLQRGSITEIRDLATEIKLA